VGQFRTFFRLSYSPRMFDRLGNTHNPLFDYSWPMVPRDFHSLVKEIKEKGIHEGMAPKGCRGLDLSRNNLETLPAFMWNCESLRDLDLSHNRLNDTLNFLRNSLWRELVVLRLHSNHLTHLPASVSCLVSLEELYLNNNLLEDLPNEFATLFRLRVLSMARNCFEEVPSALLKLPKLQVLGLGRNRLKALPDELFRHPALQKLWVNNNFLTCLPEVACRSKHLAELVSHGNPLDRDLPALSSKL